MKRMPKFPRGAFTVVGAPIDWSQLEAFATEHRRMEWIWEMVSKPIKFPNRRRREDREMPPKAA